MRALIVDDSSFIRAYLRQHLEQMGWSCDEAEDGSSAVGILRGSSAGLYDLMLVDLNMPVMNGLECVKQVRDEGLLPGMKTMMVTTEADSSFISQALENGAEEFLMKPFTPQSLGEKLMLLGFPKMV